MWFSWRRVVFLSVLCIGFLSLSMINGFFFNLGNKAFYSHVYTTKPYIYNISKLAFQKFWTNSELRKCLLWVHGVGMRVSFRYSGFLPKKLLLAKNHFSLYRILELSYMVLWRLKRSFMFHYRIFRAVYHPLTDWNEPYEVLCGTGKGSPGRYRSYEP